MHNCHTDMLAYHNDEVTLPQSEQTDMRNRRNSNRDRVKNGLKKNDQPSPDDFTSQGSYAMRTMVQYPNKDYDIDDGIYFDREKLKGSRGGDKTPQEAKQMVCDAVQDDRFKKKPEVRTNCVRVYYNEGYHVDLPVYRTYLDDYGDEKIELASTNWKESDPQSVTSWFDKQNQEKSPDTTNGRQLRRIVRFLKTFSRSRDSWSDRTATGFIITKLVTEKYHSDSAREDQSLYYTMKGIKERLDWDLEVKHPVLDEYLTNGPDDSKTKFLREKLDEALKNLDILFDPDCTRSQALKAWDKVFNTSYFSGRDSSSKSGAAKMVGATATAPSVPEILIAEGPKPWRRL